MKILIVGAGIGGLTLAAFLKRLNIDFEIVEKRTDTDKQGYSLGIWDNGRDILRKLGIEEKLDETGKRIKNFIICNGTGKILKNYNLQDLYTTYGSAYTHLDRTALLGWLTDLVGKERINRGITIDSKDQLKNYDLVVAADGVHSKVREISFGDIEYEHYSEWRLWLTWIDGKYKRDKTVVQYIEYGQFAAIFDDGGKTLLVMIARAKHSDWDEEIGRVERLKKIFNKHGLIQEILAEMKDSDIKPTNLSFVDMSKWVSGNTVLLGDAAHAMEPFAGLGASMAMEDAYILSGEIYKAKQNDISIEEALRSYEKSRKKRVATAKRVTKGMRWWAISESSFIQKLVSLFLPYVPPEYFTKDFHKLLKKEI